MSNTEYAYQEDCWIDGCNHSYEAKDFEHLARATIMHVQTDHGSVGEVLFDD